MRAILALAASTLAFSSPASVAAAQEDRYDPPATIAAGDGQAAPAADKHAPLSWAGKASPPQAPTTASTPPTAAPAPQRPAGVQAAGASPPAAAQADAATPVGVRFYSLHRDYGLTPDADPTPTERPLVLIGPPTGPQGDVASVDGDKGQMGEPAAGSASGAD